MQKLVRSVRKASLALAAVLSMTVVAKADTDKITVWKTPTCGCCTGWVEYLRERGFDVETHDLQDVTSIKHKLGLKDPSLHSCHTAEIDGYVVEGHVPVRDIRRLLAERPDVVGITAPGMPMMSPGMNSIEPEDYDVLQVDRDGGVEVFSRY